MRAGLGSGVGEVFEAAGSATAGEPAPLPAAVVPRDPAPAEPVALRCPDTAAPAELPAAGVDGAAGVLLFEVGVFAPLLGCVPALGLVVPGLSPAPGTVVPAAADGALLPEAVDRAPLPEAADGAALGRSAGLSAGPDCALAFAGTPGALAGSGVLCGPVGVTGGGETAPLSGAAGAGPFGVTGCGGEASGAVGAFWAPASAGRSSPAMVTVGGGGMSPTARGGGQPVSISIIATAQTVARPVSSRLMTLPSIGTDRVVRPGSKAGPQRLRSRVRPPRTSPAAGAVAPVAVAADAAAVAVDAVSRLLATRRVATGDWPFSASSGRRRRSAPGR